MKMGNDAIGKFILVKSGPSLTFSGPGKIVTFSGRKKTWHLGNQSGKRLEDAG